MSLVSRITSFVEAVGLDIKALRSGKAETIHTHSIEDVSALGAALAGAGGGLAPLETLLVYYGYPIAYKSMWTRSLVVDEICTKYKYWVVGDGYQDPAHEVYADTVAILSACRARGVKIFGYVPIGASTQNLTIPVIKSRIDQWVTVGVDGIFLDEFGFDYLNTRTKQIEICNYVHGKSLPYCANAWVVEDFACDNISETSFVAGVDWKYSNYTTGNPGNDVLPRNADDVYLFEDFAYTNTKAHAFAEAQATMANVRGWAVLKGFPVWGLAVFAESGPSKVNFTKTGTFTNIFDIGAYISANAFVFDVKVVGAGGYSFGSAGKPLEIPLYAPPLGATAPTTDAVIDAVAGTVTRAFGPTTIYIRNLAGQEVSTGIVQGARVGDRFPAAATVLTQAKLTALAGVSAIVKGNGYLISNNNTLAIGTGPATYVVITAGAGSNSNVDGGVPDTVYGGITSVDGGKPSTVF